jgi:2-polyprenyl-3-methyl-5-hydroxy-6-metoxy-1,4-benzoquinol methylase
VRKYIPIWLSPIVSIATPYTNKEFSMYDHALCYQKKGLARLFCSSGNKRIKEIISILSEHVDFKGKIFIDVGCSTGYVTSQIVSAFNPLKSYGVDAVQPNLEVARERYPDIEFSVLDLNKQHNCLNQYDVVTCCETLEHVGNLNIALDNLLKMKKSNGILLITVPVEIGINGILRVIWRTIYYGYSDIFGEFIPNKKFLFIKYLLSLIKSERISKYRDERTHWGTHLGFDYRDIDEYLDKNFIKFSAHNKDMNRFYIIK